MFDYNDQLFHVGVRVRDLDAAMPGLGTALGVTWAPVVERDQRVWLPGRGTIMTRLRFTYSCEGPQHVELLQGEEGSPWLADTDERGVHHLGIWSDDVAADTERFVAAGWTLEASGEAPEDGYGIFSYVRSPLGVLVEPVSSVRKDLFERWWGGQPMG
jgi:hypothetical protein